MLKKTVGDGGFNFCGGVSLTTAGVLPGGGLK